jgi:hypothetical protein
MTQSDKDFINKLQIAQLVTDDPLADDFYCQVYTAIRNKHMQQMGIPGNMTDSGSNDGRRGKGNVRTEQRIQQQVQRIVNDAKRNPKRTNGIHFFVLFLPLSRVSYMARLFMPMTLLNRSFNRVGYSYGGRRSWKDCCQLCAEPSPTSSGLETWLHQRRLGWKLANIIVPRTC